MTKEVGKNLTLFLILVGSIIIYSIGGNVRSYTLPVLLVIAGSMVLGAIVRAPKRSTAHHLPSLQPKPTPQLPRLAEKEVFEETGNVQVNALGSAYRKKEWKHIETIVDTILDNCIKTITSHIDAHTVAIFFPTKDGGFQIRRYESRSEDINKDAVIYPGVGVIGGFLKNGLKQLNLQEIMSDSMTLYYYKKDAGIRSLMACPIIVNNIERGTIIIDSTEKNHFTDANHSFVRTIADTLGQAVYYAYLLTEHKLEHFRLAAMSSIEKEFFRNLTMNVILDKMTEIIPFAISCDRLTISMKDEEGYMATIIRSWGIEAKGFQEKRFSLKEKSLASMLYVKNLAFYRNFAKDHYEIRYTPDEKSDTAFASFLAIPIGVDDCKGMILVESIIPNAFTDSNRDLLSRIATSAGLAIEKILLLEKAKNLATHDGLTGLFNHRQFQIILKDEITRAIRYNDPLSLVLCDIDFFKKLNDTHGHQFGDLVLQGVAAGLEGAIRDSIDTAARYGGEEFVLVLVKTDEKNAVETVERIRQHIADMLFKAPNGQDVHITMSFGIAVYRKHARQLDELIKKADKALYRAKDNGRNRVELF